MGLLDFNCGSEPPVRWLADNESSSVLLLLANQAIPIRTPVQSPSRRPTKHRPLAFNAAQYSPWVLGRLKRTATVENYTDLLRNFNDFVARHGSGASPTVSIVQDWLKRT